MLQRKYKAFGNQENGKAAKAFLSHTDQVTVSAL